MCIIIRLFFVTEFHDDVIFKTVTSCKMKYNMDET